MMQLKSLTLTNFRAVRHLHIDFTGNAALLLGINGQGKSTALQAIQVLLFGRCHDCNGKRIQNADLYFLAGKAQIQAVIDTPDGEITAKMVISKDGAKLHFIDQSKTALFSGNADIARQDFFAACGISMEHAECAANPHLYLSGNDAGNIGSMLSRLNGGIDQAALAADCGEHWGWVERFARNHRTGTGSVEQLEALGKEAETARRNAKKDLADAEKRRELARENAGDVQHNPARLESCEKLGRKLAQTRIQLAERLGRAQQAVTGGLSEEERTTLQAQLTDLQEQEVQLADKLGKANAATRQADELVRGRRSAVEQAKSGALTMVSAYATAKEALAKVEAGQCPTCGGKIPKKSVDAARDHYNKMEIAKAEAEAAHQKSADSLTAAMTAADAAQAEERNVSAQLRDTRDAQKDIERKLSVPEVTETPEQVQAEIDEIDARIAKGKALIAQLTAARDVDAHANDADAHKAEIARLDWAVKAFKDGGISNKYAGDAIAEFAAIASKRLAAYGYALDVRIDGKNIDLLVVTPRGARVPYAQASKGERVLAQWAAASIAPGAITCIDDLDALWGEFKGVLTSEFAKGTTGTILAASTWGMQGLPDAQKLARVLGMQVVTVDNGDESGEMAA